MKYYLLKNEKRIGPFEINELIEKGIEHETLVWGEGMKDWANAETVEEISSKLPPKFNKNNNSKKQSKTYNVLRYAVLIIIIIFLTGIAIQYFEKMSRSDNRFGNYNSPSYEEQVQSIEDIEKQDPLNYLTTSGDYRKNFWGTKFKVSLNIKNIATVANYKDIIIRFSFRSKTDTELSSIQKTFFEEAKAGTTISLKVKLDIPYNEVSKLDWEIINATPKNN